MGLIYLDSCLLIYLIEDHPVWAEPLKVEMNLHDAAKFAISPLVKLECLVRPLKAGDMSMQMRFESAFKQLALLELKDEIFVQAAQLRARFNIKTPDALHLACAQHHRCDSLWTNDSRLAQASHGLARTLVTPTQSPTP